jgi:hypothetical protein
MLTPQHVDFPAQAVDRGIHHGAGFVARKCRVVLPRTVGHNVGVEAKYEAWVPRLKLPAGELAGH